jgi:SAM-dependent methyltransferase
VERQAARMAPDSPLFIAPDEKPFAVMDEQGRYKCPHCGKTRTDAKALVENESPELGKAKNKKVELTLLIDPKWLEGCPKHDEQGREYGGSATDSVEATIRWNNARAAKMRLLEVRGALPEQVTCPDTKVRFYTDARGGTVTKSGHFECHAPTCGIEQSNVESLAKNGTTAPIANFLIQGYSRHRDVSGNPYGGRFFSTPNNTTAANLAWAEWDSRKDNDLRDYWPRSEIPFGHMTHQRQPLPDHGFTHWWKMFNPRQLLINSQLLKAISNAKATESSKLFVLGFYQNFLRNENLFCFWHSSHDHFAPHLSNNNYHPKTTVVEVGPFCPVGYGPWPSATGGLEDALNWREHPWEIFPAARSEELASHISGKGVRVLTHDPVQNSCELVCKSSTELSELKQDSYDLVVTDPPFGGLLHYSELSDFFYVWLRLVLKQRYPELFSADYVPKALEAVANEARQPEDPDGFYQRILADCWREAYRILKPGGILAFTFHHSEDEPWVRVLESLFEAGFYLEATYPIRSDETKGEGEFGSKQIEYDIIHVCRKRMTAPQPISWARLRRQITDDVRRIKNLLSQHQKEGLPAADLQVIKRGKALEYFSRHYGQVFIEKDRPFTIREALVGINNLLDDDTGTASGPEAPPPNAEPYTRQFFRIFYDTAHVPRDQMQKFLRGTGIAPSDFEDRGWCSEKNKTFTLTPPVELAVAWKGASRKGMARDFDQSMFLVGACVDGSGIRVEDTLNSPNFAPHPATGDLVDWLCRHGGSQEIKFAAQRGRTIYRDWLSKNKRKVEEQMRLFDLEG